MSRPSVSPGTPPPVASCEFMSKSQAEPRRRICPSPHRTKLRACEPDQNFTFFHRQPTGLPGTPTARWTFLSCWKHCESHVFGLFRIALAMQCFMYGLIRTEGRRLWIAQALNLSANLFYSCRKPVKYHRSSVHRRIELP